MEFVVRRQLTQLGQSLSGLYSGNPKRQTARPTDEQLFLNFPHTNIPIKAENLIIQEI